jgi:endonuclease YncB( thermonuclease family)
VRGFVLALSLAGVLLAGCQSAPQVPTPTVTPVALSVADPNSYSESTGGLPSDSQTVPLTTSLTFSDSVTQTVAITSNLLPSPPITQSESLTSTGVLSSSEVARPLETPTPAPPGVIVLAPADAPTIAPTLTPLPTPEVGTVMQVINADTLLVRIGNAPTLVGYLLIDAPGLDHPLGELALEVNRALVEGQSVQLVRDISDVGRDHRRLRLVYLNDGTLVNAELLRQGWAQVEESPLDEAYEAQFRQVEADARAAGVGMWAGLQFPVTNAPAEIFAGPDRTFALIDTLPINQLLEIDGATPDKAWYRLEGGWWIQAQFVTNPPQEVALAAIDTPVPTTTATNTPTPTATPTISPTPTFAIGSVQIAYLDKDDEWLVIRNGTNRLLDLEDWKIFSERGGEICTLAGQLAPFATMIVWSQWGPDFACNMEFPMWDDLLDDSALLYSPSGFVIFRYADPPEVPAEEGGERD